MSCSVAELIAPRPRVTFMDCDGVIYDANSAKCAAFEVALEGYPRPAVDDLLTWHRASGGISRFVKLRRFFTELHPVPDPERHIARALDRFAAASRAGYERLTPRREALAFAARLGGPERVYVVSGSAEDELRGVFDAAGLASRFAAVLGSPTTKIEHMTRILRAHGVNPRQSLMVGDGRGDWEAAVALGVPFIYLAEMSEWRAAPRELADSELVAMAPTWDHILAALNDASPLHHAAERP